MNHDLPFEALLAAARRRPESIDFALLRTRYVQSTGYRPLTHFSEMKLKGSTNHATSFDDVALFCQKFLDHNAMDLEVWMLLEFSYDQLEQHDLTAHCHGFVSRMIDAMLATGDGKSEATAWRVVAIAEVYTLLSVMGLQEISSAVTEKDGCFFQEVECVPRRTPDHSPQRLFFDITAPYRYFLDTTGIEHPTGT